jgi:hypothetical protein
MASQWQASRHLSGQKITVLAVKPLSCPPHHRPGKTMTRQALAHQTGHRAKRQRRFALRESVDAECQY